MYIFVQSRIILLILLLFPLALCAQVKRYVVTFRDKKGSPYTLSDPQRYLSAKALMRRQHQQIAVDSSDLPVSPAYVDSLRKAGEVQVLYTLRWFNQAIIATEDAAAIQRISQFPFVSGATAESRQASEQRETPRVGRNERQAGANAGEYGGGFMQLHLNEGVFLHEKGWKGEGMVIAVLDAGFPGVDKNRAFTYLNGRRNILATRNFSDGSGEVYGYGSHGAHVLSILAAYLPGEMIGSAPDASYVLLRTEETATESPIEEYNWVAAAELSDSIGVDVLSSSVGYTEFDDSVFNHTYSQLDGRSTTIARGAAWAARKGILVVNCAGNEGFSSWKYLLSPADVDSVLAVAAVNESGQVAAFSSYGPTADGRIKPDVAALGVNTQYVNPEGRLLSGDGTSYACPVIAGLAACLWQAFPKRSNREIMDVIKRSSSHYTHPDNRTGYGVPNFRIAYDLLLQQELSDTIAIRNSLGDKLLKAFPNPFTNRLNIYYKSSSSLPLQLQLADAGGKLVRSGTIPASEVIYGYFNWDKGLSGLPAGVYYLQAIQGGERTAIKVLKM
ncbi:S8 family serine peptidase [Chitinophaga pendula]|uniref:S8 family serine peptidase n=1 Tax=Chitinophaga TaxID=79328 RepID=UPI000BB09215|nr:MULTISPECIES: S8 family serine peptidase [Chitinophaga]ASZ14565.1 peptidase S8 [Chitinophaga sp. MD30]UCJ07784.1 S8 family serine peptidase [Chitinophaga pendula]